MCSFEYNQDNSEGDKDEEKSKDKNNKNKNNKNYVDNKSIINTKENKKSNKRKKIKIYS